MGVVPRQRRRYLTPSLGHRRLDELTPAEITALYARLLRQVAAAGGRSLDG